MTKQIDKFRNDYLSYNIHEQDIRKEERNLANIESAKVLLQLNVSPEIIAKSNKLDLSIVLELKSSLGL